MDNPVEGAPQYTPLGAAMIYAQKRIKQLEHDLALARRGWAYAQGQQLMLVLERAKLVAASEGVMDILGRAESNASGNPEFDYVGPRVAAFRAAIKEARHG